MTKEALEYLAKTDKILAQLIQKFEPMDFKFDPNFEPFESLVESVTHQQLSGKAAQTIFGRLKALYPKKKFPKPEDILKTPHDKLRGVGLSNSKVLAVKDIALKTKEGLVPPTKQLLKMSDEEIIERLVQIRGVGQWTVEMLLIFRLGRPDVLPVDDFAVRKGFALAYAKTPHYKKMKKEQLANQKGSKKAAEQNTVQGSLILPKPKQLLEFGELWKPHRTTATWYMWRALNLEK